MQKRVTVSIRREKDLKNIPENLQVQTSFLQKEKLNSWYKNSSGIYWIISFKLQPQYDECKKIRGRSLTSQMTESQVIS